MTTGGTELIVVLAIAVMLFGPKKLPELARTIGEAMGEYHKATREFENEVRKASTSVDKEISGVTNTTPPTQRTPKTGQVGTIPPKATLPKTKSPGIAPKPTSIRSNNPKVKEIAKNLGIDPSNKTEAQLLKEISLKTKKQKTT